MKNIMTVNNIKYSIDKLLGHGKGGYSYLAMKDDKQYVYHMKVLLSLKI